MGRSGMGGLMMGGIILAVLGVIGFAIPIFTTQQTTDVARIGDLKLQATESRSYAIPPIASGGAVLLGIVLMGAAMYQKR